MSPLLLLTLILGSLAGGIVAWQTLRPARERPPAASYEFAVIERPPAFKRLGTIFTAAPLVMLVRIIREPDPIQALGFFGVMLLMCGLGSVVLIIARRKLLFSRDGIQSIGFPAFRVPWDRVKDINARNWSGPMSNIHFVTDTGRKIVVDGTMVGWRDLLKFLGEVPNPDAKRMAGPVLSAFKE